MTCLIVVESFLVLGLGESCFLDPDPDPDHHVEGAQVMHRP